MVAILHIFATKIFLMTLPYRHIYVKTSIKIAGVVTQAWCQLLRIEGVAWSAQLIPKVVNLSFLDRSRYFFLQVAPHLSSRG
jgi:hypothetical protein